MAPRNEGLIINISSWGGRRYIFNVPYGIGKCAVDRMAADCSVELKDSNVAMISFYPGAVKTELVETIISKNNAETKESLKKKDGRTFREVFENGETTEFSGKILVALAQGMIF